MAGGRTWTARVITSPHETLAGGRPPASVHKQPHGWPVQSRAHAHSTPQTCAASHGAEPPPTGDVSELGDDAVEGVVARPNSIRTSPPRFAPGLMKRSPCGAPPFFIAFTPLLGASHHDGLHHELPSRAFFASVYSPTTLSTALSANATLASTYQMRASVWLTAMPAITPRARSAPHPEQKASLRRLGESTATPTHIFATANTEKMTQLGMDRARRDNVSDTSCLLITWSKAAAPMTHDSTTNESCATEQSTREVCWGRQILEQARVHGRWCTKAYRDAY